MILKEVIKRLRWQQESYNKNYIDYLDINEAYNIAIKKLEDLDSQNNFRWVKKGEIFPIYYCPNCGKEALGRMPSIDNFEYVKSPFCPFCGVRLGKPRITKQMEEENEQTTD